MQHLLGIGHVRRAALITRALSAAGLDVTVASGGFPVAGVDYGAARVVQLPRLFWLPPPLLKMSLTVGGRKEAYDSLFASLELDLSKIASTGWQQPISLDEGLRRALSRIDI